MKLKSLFAAALLVVASSSLALAQSDCTKIVPPSPWGPNDQTGATNRVTAAVTKAAAAEIKDGKVIEMSYPLADGIPLFGTRFTKTILTATSLAPGAAFGRSEEHTSELQSLTNLVCRLLLEKKKNHKPHRQH